MWGKEGVCQTAYTITEVNQGDAALSASQRQGQQDEVSSGGTSHVLSVPDHSGKQLNIVQDDDEVGTQNAKFPKQSQTQNQLWLTCQKSPKLINDLLAIVCFCLTAFSKYNIHN